MQGYIHIYIYTGNTGQWAAGCVFLVACNGCWSLCYWTVCVFMCVCQTDSKVNGTALSSPSTSSQRSDSSFPLLRVAASQTTDTMGNTDTHTHTQAQKVAWKKVQSWLLPLSGDDELSSPSQDPSGLEEVMEQLNNSFPHSQGRKENKQNMTTRELWSICVSDVGGSFISTLLLSFLFFLPLLCPVLSFSPWSRTEKGTPLTGECLTSLFCLFLSTLLLHHSWFWP